MKKIYVLILVLFFPASLVAGEKVLITPERKKALEDKIAEVAAHFKADAKKFSGDEYIEQMDLVERALDDKTYTPEPPFKTEAVEKSLFPEQVPMVDGLTSAGLAAEHVIDEQELVLMAVLYALSDAKTTGDRRLRALKLLGSTTDERAVARLKAECSSKDPHTRLTAVTALGKLSLKDAQDVMLRAATDPEPSVRRAAVTWLAEFNVPGRMELLAKAASDADWRVRCEAVRSLVSIGTPAAVRLIGGRLEDGSVLVARETLIGLEALDEPGPIEKMGKLALGHKDFMVRAWAGYLVAKNENKEKAAGILVKMLDDKNVEVRKEAAKGLKKTSSREYLDRIAKQAFNDESDAVRGHLYPVVAELGGAAWLGRFEKALEKAEKDEDFANRSALLRTFAFYYPKAALSHFKMIIMDPASFYRNRVAAYLIHCHSRESMDILMGAFGTEDKTLRRLIFDSILYLSGRKTEYTEEEYLSKEVTDADVGEWRNWWKENRDKIDIEKAVANYGKAAAGLVKEGDDLLKKGRIQEAMKKYKQAQFLDSSVGDIFERIKKGIK